MTTLKPLVENAINQPRHYDWFNADDVRVGDVLSSARLCGERAKGYTEYQVAVHLDQSPEG
jgi:hypothetical protein